MTTISNESLHSYSDRIKGKSTIITGAASGYGRAAALLFAKYGAKVVLGDLNTEGLQNVSDEIMKAGGTAIYRQTNVLKWEDQTALFEFAMMSFGSVDVVVVNAGVYEIGNFEEVKVVNGLPVRPSYKTIEVNLIAAMDTTHLALYYLPKNHVSGSLKSVVLVGSMASWQQFPKAETYAASKHGILGFARSINPCFDRLGIRISIIHPWFSDTALIPFDVKVLLTGLPLTSVAQVASTIFHAATEPDSTTSGSAYVLLDDGPTLRLEKEKLKEGVYKAMDARMKMIENVVLRTKTAVALLKLFGMRIVLLLIPLAVCYWFYLR